MLFHRDSRHLLRVKTHKDEDPTGQPVLFIGDGLSDISPTGFNASTLAECIKLAMLNTYNMSVQSFKDRGISHSSTSFIIEVIGIASHD